MKTNIPEDLKAAVPPTPWGKVLNATPVVMTVIATMLAGLSSSEMTKAQYDRSLAAQQQSKAGDQWGFFQAKRLRSAVQAGTLDNVEAVLPADHALDAAGLRALAATLPEPAQAQSALEFLLSGKLPELPPAPAVEPDVKAALDAIAQDRPDAEMTAVVAKVKPAQIDAALRAAQERARAFDHALAPVVSHGDRLGDLLDPVDTPHRALARDFAVLRLRYSSQRYDAEARLNQAIASLYELQVRQGNISAEHHHRRSQRFFYGMLAAQAATIIATFAIAARNRNFLWSLAAAAGAGALLFAGYVFLFV